MRILETERLILRRLVAEDLADLFELYRDPEIRRHYPEGVLSLAETQDELDWFKNGHPDDSRLGLWAAIHKPSGAFIGRCGLLPWTIEGSHEIEIAYLIAKPYWRQGLGGEAARALVRHGFETLGLKRLIALIDPAHIASIRTAQQAGLSFEREIEMEGVVSALYAIARR